MTTPTKTVITPIGKHKVEIKEWLTGREREFVNEPMFNAVKPKASMVGGKPDIDMGQFDVKGYMKESAHREIETFVVSVDGVKEKVLDLVLGMHEDDTEFVKTSIEAISKKKDTPTT